MEWLVFSGIIIAVLSALTWGAYKYGRIKEKQKTDAGKADDMAADAAIASKPYCDFPVDGMHD